MINKYQEILSTLTTDLIVIVFNLIGLFLLISIITNIVILLLGNSLIDRFQLDIKFPKVSKYIKIKQELNKNYLILYFVSFYVMSFLIVISNIYMFLLNLNLI